MPCADVTFRTSKIDDPPSGIKRSLCEFLKKQAELAVEFAAVEVLVGNIGSAGVDNVVLTSFFQ